MVSVSKQFGIKVEGGILQNPARESNAVERRHSASSALLFTANTVQYFHKSRLLLELG
jgi:hypothetical protein